MIEGVFVEGLIYSIMVLGVFITFRILDFPDLTVDGSFPLGAAVMAILISNGVNLFVAVVVAFLAGVVAGLVTAVVHNKLHVPNLLAGILTMTMLWSINIRVLGNKPNLPLMRQVTILTKFNDLTAFLPSEWSLLVFFKLLAFGLKFLLDLFFRTDLGLTLGAMGDNQQMVVTNGVNPETLKMIGVGLANGLVATSGAFVAQYQGFADVNLGQGIIIAGLEPHWASDAPGHPGFDPVPRDHVSRQVLWVLHQPDSERPQAADRNPHHHLTRRDATEKAEASPHDRSVRCPGRKRRRPRMIRLESVTSVFNPGTADENVAVRNVHLTVEEGQFTTIIGSNGAGKSTLFNLIAGTIPVSGGSVHINGVDVTRHPEHRRARYIGRIFQDPLLGTASNMMVADNMMICYRKGMKGLRISLNQKMRSFFRERLGDLQMDLETRMNDNVGLLSGGQRQALTLLMMVLSKPSLVLLDEHTAALDPKNAQIVLDLTSRFVRDYGLTTMMITHNMGQAIRYGDRLLMMDRGEIILDVSGREKQTLTVEKLVEKFHEIRDADLESDEMMLSQRH
jgi:putative ABC transport system ATP-binding protein